MLILKYFPLHQLNKRKWLEVARTCSASTVHHFDGTVAVAEKLAHLDKFCFDLSFLAEVGYQSMLPLP